MKRISVIVSSIIIFHTPLQPINALGAAIAILGTFIYSQVNSHFLRNYVLDLYTLGMFYFMCVCVSNILFDIETLCEGCN